MAERLAEFRTFRAVCGNCDGGDLRLMYKEKLRFKCEDVDVLMKHIGGYPGNYDSSIARKSTPCRLNCSSAATVIF